MYFQFQSLSPLEILRQISFRSQAHVRSVPPPPPQLRRRKWGETNRVWRGEGGRRHAHNVVTLFSLTQLTSLFAVEGVALFDGRETSGLHSTKLLNQQSHASAPHRQTWNQLVLSSSYSPLLTLPKLSLCPCQVCLSVQNTTLLTYQENLTLLNIPGKSDIAEIPGKSDIAEYTRKIWPRGFSWCCRLRKQPHIVLISGICWRATSQWDLFFRTEETIVVTTATPAVVNLGQTAVQ